MGCSSSMSPDLMITNQNKNQQCNKQQIGLPCKNPNSSSNEDLNKSFSPHQGSNAAFDSKSAHTHSHDSLEVFEPSSGQNVAVSTAVSAVSYDVILR